MGTWILSSLKVWSAVVVCTSGFLVNQSISSAVADEVSGLRGEQSNRNSLGGFADSTICFRDCGEIKQLIF
jgi:hypothetical protein